MSANRPPRLSSKVQKGGHLPILVRVKQPREELVHVGRGADAEQEDEDERLEVEEGGLRCAWMSAQGYGTGRGACRGVTDHLDVVRPSGRERCRGPELLVTRNACSEAETGGVLERLTVVVSWPWNEARDTWKLQMLVAVEQASIRLVDRFDWVACGFIHTHT